MPIRNLGQIVGLAAVLTALNASAQYDYFDHHRELIRNRIQAVLGCNGLSALDHAIKHILSKGLACPGDGFTAPAFASGIN